MRQLPTQSPKGEFVHGRERSALAVRPRLCQPRFGVVEGDVKLIGQDRDIGEGGGGKEVAESDLVEAMAD
jgi:hypothetical protein